MPSPTWCLSAGPEVRLQQQRRVLTFMLHQAQEAGPQHAGSKQAALSAGLSLLGSDLCSPLGADFSNADIWGPCLVRCGASQAAMSA